MLLPLPDLLAFLTQHIHFFLLSDDNCPYWSSSRTHNLFKSKRPDTTQL